MSTGRAPYNMIWLAPLLVVPREHRCSLAAALRGVQSTAIPRTQGLGLPVLLDPASYQETNFGHGSLCTPIDYSVLNNLLETPVI